MKDDRDAVLANVRAALRNRPERSPRPDFDPNALVVRKRLEGADLWEAFARNFSGVRGYPMTTVDALAAFLRERKLFRGYCDPALKESVGERLGADFSVVYEYSRSVVDEIDFGITRASGVIAETGTIILRDRATSNRLAAVAPWAHIAVVEPEAIHRTVGDALGAFDDDPNTIFVTGPSKTADVEGILIEGVHGPGEQVCLRL